jgi:hypothetical protein
LRRLGWVATVGLLLVVRLLLAVVVLGRHAGVVCGGSQFNEREIEPGGVSIYARKSESGDGKERERERERDEK